jgi:hypothetical protein
MRVDSRDGSLSETEPLYTWNADILKGVAMIGREPNPGSLLAGLLRDAGFTGVKERVFRVPIGVWPKDKRMVSLAASSMLEDT